MRNTYTNMRGVTHDVNHVMTRVILLTEQLKEHPDTCVAENATSISEAVEKVMTIWRQGTRATAPDNKNGVMDADRFEKILQYVVDLVGIESKLSQSPIDFSVAVEMDRPVCLDEAKLFRIVFNLVLNAANAIATSGGSRVNIRAERTDTSLLISVIDDGPGLPPAIFDFLSSNGPETEIQNFPVSRSTGLPTTLSLVRDMDGSLHPVAASRDVTGDGTHFRLKLPASPTMRQHARSDDRAHLERQLSCVGRS